MATKAELTKLRDTAKLMNVDATGKAYEDLLEEFLSAVEAVPVENEASIPSEAIAYYNEMAAKLDAAAATAAAKAEAPPQPIPAVPAVVEAPAPPKPAEKSKPPKPAPAPPAVPPKPRKPSAYPLIIEYVFKNPAITKAEVAAIVKDKGFEVSTGTFDIQFNDVRRVYGVVKELGLLKD